MNRAERRRLIRNGVHLVEMRGGGMLENASARYGGQVPEVAEGEHLWVMMGCWRISDPAAVFTEGHDQHLDMENLLTVEGPGCYICETPWNPELAALPCTGDPSRK